VLYKEITLKHTVIFLKGITISDYCNNIGVSRYAVSLMKMSPLTAVLKCPHYEKGHYSNESGRAAEVPSDKDGNRW